MDWSIVVVMTINQLRVSSFACFLGFLSFPRIGGEKNELSDFINSINLYSINFDKKEIESCFSPDLCSEQQFLSRLTELSLLIMLFRSIPLYLFQRTINAPIAHNKTKLEQ